MESLSPGVPREWTLEVNGEVVQNVSFVKLSHPAFGELIYGDAGGYDTWSFTEIGRGGSLIIAYAEIKGELYVGGVIQNRPNQGGKVWNIARGFLDPGENHFDCASREIEEEMGVKTLQLILLGAPLNPNSAFFDTQSEGVRVFGLQVNMNALQPDGDGYVFRGGC